MKTILNISFKTLLDEEELKSTSFNDMLFLANVPGLIDKTFIKNPATGKLGAVYKFEDEKAADDYLNTPFFKDLRNRYQIEDGSLSVEKVHVSFILKGLNLSANSKIESI